jgi:uncharacterized LabA/DUF88 family protein
MIPDNTLIFIDGENLSLRYKEMLAAGKVPRADNIYIEDCFVWNQRVLNGHIWNIKRLSYYTSVIGDDDRVRKVRDQIASTTFSCVKGRTENLQHYKTGQIVPFVRKKAARSRKESICDIAIAVDVMRACYRDHAMAIWIFSGDGDFVQLFHEVVHSGKCSYASAFSSGLNEDISFVVDEFLPLDEHFFLTEEEIVAMEAQRKLAAAAQVEANVTERPAERKNGKTGI